MFFLLCVIIVIVSFAVWRSASKKVQEHNLTYKGLSTVGVASMLIFTLLAVGQCLTVVPAGNVGVVDFFGTVSEITLKAGINFVNPFARVIKFSVQTVEHKEVMQVLSREGLTIGLEISALYRLDPDSAAVVYRKLGTEYSDVVLVPQFRSVSRAVTASFQASALYSTEREKLGSNIQTEIAALLKPRGIIVETTPLRNVALPSQLTEAIEQKQRAEQESQRMEFVLTKERQEADRKRIEAKGIADFQTIVAQGISDQLLRWKGIEATEKLANSANTKVIIVGAGKDGLPFILDTK